MGNNIHQYILQTMNTSNIWRMYWLYFQSGTKKARHLKKPFEFMPKSLYDSFAWSVYGMKGVATQIPEECEMVQCRGGIDDVEHEFARNREMNSNPTIAEMRDQITQGAGVRSSDSARHTINNTSGNKQVFYKELLTAKRTKK